MNFYARFLLPALLLTGCASTLQSDAHRPNSKEKPSEIVVLTYYPDCDYQVLGTVSGHSGISRSDKQFNKKVLASGTQSLKNAKGTPKLAAEQLKYQAKKLGADAIAITQYYATQGQVTLGRGRSVSIGKHVMRAQAIKLCNDEQYDFNSPTPNLVRFNELGQLNRKQPLATSYSFDFEKFGGRSSGAKIAGLSSSNIEVNGNWLGFSLGERKTKVIEHLGNPSATVRVSKDHQALLFGRNHLFLFEHNSLVGMEFSDWLLPLHLNNRVAFNPVLEEASITINNYLKTGDSLEHTIDNLKLKSPKLLNDSLKIEGKASITTLDFTYQKGLYDNTKMYKLNGIAVYKRGYKRFDWRNIAAKTPSISFIDLADSALKSKGGIDKSAVSSAFGEPIMILAQQQGKENWVYNGGLIATFLNGGLIKYTLDNNRNEGHLPACKQCLYVGQPLSEIPSQFVVQRSQEQVKLESSGFSYLVNLSEAEMQNVEDVEVTIKR